MALPCQAETDAVGEWKKQLVIRLTASKRFPLEAIGQSGTAIVAFVLDRSGKLISNEIKQSSGIKALDTEAVAMVERAQPFPTPPPEIDDDNLKLTLPLVFNGRPKIPTESSQIPKLDISGDNATVDARLRGVCRGC